MFNSTTDPKIDQLAAVPLFSRCSKKELKELAQLCDEIEVPAGKVIFIQGSTSFDCYIIETGQVKVEVDGVIVAELQAGSHFGEFAPIDKRPRSATVTTLTDCKLAILGTREFGKALNDIPGLAMNLLATLTERVRKANLDVHTH